MHGDSHREALASCHNLLYYSRGDIIGRRTGVHCRRYHSRVEAGKGKRGKGKGEREKGKGERGKGKGKREKERENVCCRGSAEEHHLCFICFCSCFN